MQVNVNGRHGKVGQKSHCDVSLAKGCPKRTNEIFSNRESLDQSAFKQSPVCKLLKQSSHKSKVQFPHEHVRQILYVPLARSPQTFLCVFLWGASFTAWWEITLLSKCHADLNHWYFILSHLSTCISSAYTCSSLPAHLPSLPCFCLDLSHNKKRNVTAK